MMHSRESELRKFVAPEFVFGVGSLQLAGQYGRNLGGSKALVVSDPGVVAAGWAQQVLASVEAAGLESTLFTQVTPNPRFDEVTAGARVYAEQGCDVIIAVGGGSVIDCGKCIGLLSANPGGLRALVGVDNVGAPMPPTICIPTTAGTSADVSQFAVIADRQIKRKLLIISKAVVPDISLIDPATLTTMDAFLSACTGMDALIHALEAYVSLGHSPLTDNHALQAMRLISSNLQKSIAEPNNLDYRTNMMLGSLEAGLAFSNASLGAVHAMSHSLGGLLDLPHGQCNAMLLDGVVDFNYGHAEQRYRDAAAALGIEAGGLTSSEIRKRLRAEIRQLRDAVGLGDTLSRSGVHRTEVHELAEAALDDPCVVTNPRQVNQRDIEVIYEESL
ncbi:MAG TPA: alcohol dehydrogenase-like regulatory protein ErcA [Candidatus Acidoferrum sp.]|nr:alcohol dehydrogenase-like regulatory protein ErcA [Candidatus Acidoferrum sp.]